MKKYLSIMCALIMIFSNYGMGIVAVSDNLVLTEGLGISEEDFVTLEKDKVYQFENMTKDKIVLKAQENKNSSIDYKVPIDGGGIRHLDYNSNIEGKVIEAGCKAILGVRNEDTKFYLPKEYQNGLIEINEPVAEIIRLEQNQTLRYETIGAPIAYDTSGTENNGLRYIIKYYYTKDWLDENDWIFDVYGGSFDYDMDIIEYQVKSGEYMEFYLPYEYKDNYKIIDKKIVEKVDIKPSSFYEINHNTEKLKCGTVAYLEKDIEENIDFTVQNGNYGLYRIGENYTGDRMIILFGDVFKFKFNGSENRSLYIPYELKDSIKEIDTLNMDKFEVEEKESLEITNDEFIKKEGIIRSNKKGGTCEVETKNKYGESVKSTIYDNGTFSLDKGESVVITPGEGSSYTVITPNDCAYTEFKVEDINKDKKIDVLDLAIVSKSYNHNKDEFENVQKFDFRCDLNEDNIIDLYDLVLVSKQM